MRRRALAREGVKVLIGARRERAFAEAARDIVQTTQTKIEMHRATGKLV
ncbi:MAG: hypothetical protein J2P54_21560 [Bradyrhizobiaceae bacterium]|nr:hypothetical protein [Bradyrhizobiaceae bacterium]